MIIKIDRMHIVGYGKKILKLVPRSPSADEEGIIVHKENGAKIPTLDKLDFLHGI
jgi:hypothetical protein